MRVCVDLKCREKTVFRRGKKSIPTKDRLGPPPNPNAIPGDI